MINAMTSFVKQDTVWLSDLAGVMLSTTGQLTHVQLADEAGDVVMLEV